MKIKEKLCAALAGGAAGAINGLFGAGGGMILVPLLRSGQVLHSEELFSSSIVIILPMCIVSLLTSTGGNLPLQDAWPFLLGGIPGGLLAGFWGSKIPDLWLHRFLGVLIIYGGIRYLC